MNAESQVEFQIKDLFKSFDENQVLKGINLEIYSGEMVAIVGGSGCGKTVLLNSILGQYAVDKGSICILDRTHELWALKNINDFSALDIDDIHKHWGVVFQRNALFSGSVYFNIALWLKEIKGLEDEVIQSIATRALASVDLPNDKQFMEKSSNDLSGGMAKRLAIARAISMDPYVLFYDEPTTGLDPSSSTNIHDLIFNIHDSSMKDGSKRTSIIITHDKDLLSRLRPRTIMLHHGKIHFDGPYDEFEKSQSDVIRPYFEMMPVLHKQLNEETGIEIDLSKRKGLLVE
ncbi:MAG: phospholipid/cholesterol/gamma-HCH transport system ATP-binding protein [Gammaproteobacteria bacterium]|jgi:phospholipid/cholesterol/gamma-HCH transport system ATP-binding protein